MPHGHSWRCWVDGYRTATVTPAWYAKVRIWGVTEMWPTVKVTGITIVLFGPIT